MFQKRTTHKEATILYFTKTQIVLDNGDRLVRHITTTRDGNTSYPIVGDRTNSYTIKPHLHLYNRYLIQELQEEQWSTLTELRTEVDNKDTKTIRKLTMKMGKLNYQIELLAQRDVDSLENIREKLFRTDLNVSNFQYELSKTALKWTMDIVRDDKIILYLTYDSECNATYYINSIHDNTGFNGFYNKTLFEIALDRKIATLI
jgi:hypothetical protein